MTSWETLVGQAQGLATDVLGPVWEMGTDLMKRSMENGVALPSLQRAAAGRPHSRL